MAYSSIVRKGCKCGCGKYPTMGFQGFNADCRPDLKEAAIKKQKDRNALRSDLAHVRKLAVEVDGAKAPKDYKSKSELLREADRLFADFIKERDTDKNGFVYCPCCKGKFKADAVDSDGNKIINCMHFVDRDVYSLRYDEDAAHAGHAGCNKNQHYQPSGIEYQNFKLFLEEKFGTHAVHEMELQKRKINKISEQDLKYVIEYYSQLKTET